MLLEIQKKNLHLRNLNAWRFFLIDILKKYLKEAYVWLNCSSRQIVAISLNTVLEWGGEKLELVFIK